MSVFKIRTEGSGEISTSAPVPVGATYRLVSVSCVFATAPTTSENYTIELNSIGGAAYDVQLYSVDPAAGATTDILWQPDEELFLIGGDAVDIAFAGTDGYGWGIEVTFKAVP
jgi:hypothetical protein